MKRILAIACLLLLSVGAKAQGDTLTISQFKALLSVVTTAPFMADSINVNGLGYNPLGQLSMLPNVRLDNPSLQEVTTDAEGFLQVDSLLSGEQQLIQTYFASILSPDFETGTYLVECDTPFNLYMDGYLMASSQQGGSEVVSFSLTPSVGHRIALRLLSKPGGASKCKVSVVPAKSGSRMQFTTDDKEYMSMDYMRTGLSVSEVFVSPSGKYTKLVLKEQVETKNVYTVLLYEGSRLIARLDGSYLQTQWMPHSDKLWWTKKSDTGLQLLLLDPATLKVEELYPSLPKEDYFVVAPSEDKLIYMVTAEGPKSGGVVERVLGRYDTNDQYRDRTFLAMFDFNTGRYQPLTFGHRGTSLHDIARDGKELIFSTSRPTTEIPFSESDYMVMDLETLEVDTLFSADADLSRFYYTSDPRYLLVLGTANAFNGIGRNLPEGREVNTYDMQLFLYDREQKSAKPLTRDFDPSVQEVAPLSGRFEVIFTAENKDYVSLYRLDLRSGRITQVPTSEEVVRRFDVDNSGNLIAYAGQSVNNSDRFYQITKGTERIVYDLATDKMKDLQLGTVADWSFRMPNGDEVPGRYYLPPHFDPSKKYPMIVYYYGGTAPTIRTFEGSYSLPMYAAQDYVVLTLNPSGTTGWGQEYASRHLNAWGKRTADEIISAVKGFCAEHSYVNAERIGCVGASYGGFMTQYLQTVTDIFAAAVSHAGISSIASYWGEGTWGIGYSTVASHGSYPWNNPQLYTEQSPLYNADKINTPLLLLHGTADVNVPIGESVQMYNALKILGKEVEFIKVYGEDHGIYDPEKRYLWMQSTMAWFQKWLKDDPTWWDTLYPSVHL